MKNFKRIKKKVEWGRVSHSPSELQLSLSRTARNPRRTKTLMAAATGLFRCFYHPTPTSNPLLTPTAKPYLLRPRSYPNLSRTSPLPSAICATLTPASDRLISAASYALPFFNSLQYGRFVFHTYPRLSVLLEPLLPVVSLYRSVPYASFVAFFGLYLGVVRNPSFSHYVRFNAMQAVTLDVLLVLPLLLQRIFSPGRAGVGFQVMVWGHNVLFVFSALCFMYSLGCCVLGRTPHLPFVADAAGRQL